LLYSTSETLGAGSTHNRGRRAPAAPPDRLIGREDELACLRSLLLREGVRLLTSTRR